MPNRGMLPKFRPAPLDGRIGGARPTIRPVGKPVAPPPPPPSPPRKMSSGIRHPSPSPHGPAIEGHADLQTPSFIDPPTMAAARQRIHEIARELPREQDRRDMPRFDDETQARPTEDHRFQDYHHAPAAPLDAPYDSLPSLEVGAGIGFDRFDSNYDEESDPSTAHRGVAHHDHQYEQYDRSSYEESYEENRHAVDSDRYSDEDQRRFDDEPPPAQANPHNRTAAFPGVSEDSGSGPRQRSRKDAAPVHHLVAAAPQYDAAAYEANYGRREGSIQRRPKMSDDEFPATQHEGSARNGSYQAPPRSAPRMVDPDQQQQQQQQRFDAPKAQESYQRARKDSERRNGSYQQQQQQQQQQQVNEIPQAPRVPAEMKVPANFVMGVQPIRTPSNGMPAGAGYSGGGMSAIEAFPPPMMQAPIRTPMMGVGVPAYGSPQHHPGTMAASPRAMHQANPMQHMQHMQHMQQQQQPHMHVRPATTNAPVGHQLQMTEVEEAQQGSKVGRFAWFVFGAAFGIFFAFFATGFVPRLGKKEEITFPNPPALPAPQQVAPPVVQPPPPPVQVAQPAPPPPVLQQPPPMQAMAPLAPFAPQGAAPPAFNPNPSFQQPQQPFGVVGASPAPQFVQQPPQQQPAGRQVAAAPPPQRGTRAGTIASRGNNTRPAAPPPPRAPAANSGDDDAPAPKTTKKESSDVSDLLNAGLAN